MSDSAVIPPPDYYPVDSNGFLHVRRFNYKTTHLVDAVLAWPFVVAAQWIGPSYWALTEPWVALCGAVLHPDHRGMIAMKIDGKDVTCLGCRRTISALSELLESCRSGDFYQDYDESCRLIREAEVITVADCETIQTVAYVVGNPWPICYDCRRHVYMIEATGEWRHFPGSTPKPHGPCHYDHREDGRQ